MWFPNSSDLVTVSGADGIITIERGEVSDTPALDEHLDEGKLYQGRLNMVVSTKSFKLVHRGQFDMHHYPFDTQYCRIQVCLLRGQRTVSTQLGYYY